MGTPSSQSSLECRRRVLQQDFEIPPEAVTPEAHRPDDLDPDSVHARLRQRADPAP